jgi:hypothetical protein
MSKVIFIGLDVHADTIAVAVSQHRWPARFAPRTLLRFPATTRQSAPPHRIRTLALVVHATCGFSVNIDAKVLMFHTTASSRFRPPICRMPLRP